MATLRSLQLCSSVRSPMFIFLKSSALARLKFSRLSTYTRPAYSRTMHADSLLKARPAIRIILGLRELLSTLKIYVTCLLRCTAVRYGGMLLSSALLSNASSSAPAPEAIFNSPGTLIVDGELLDSVRALERELNAVHLQPDICVSSTTTGSPSTSTHVPSDTLSPSSNSEVSNTQSGASDAVTDVPKTAHMPLSSDGAPSSTIAQSTHSAPIPATNPSKPGAQSALATHPSHAKAMETHQSAKQHTQQATPHVATELGARSSAHSTTQSQGSQPPVDTSHAGQTVGTSVPLPSSSSAAAPAPAPTTAAAPSAVVGPEGVSVCAGAGTGEWHSVIDEPDFKVWKRPVAHSPLFEYKGMHLTCRVPTVEYRLSILCSLIS